MPQLPWSPSPMRHLVRVPQKIYNVGRGQWNFKRSEPITFSVNGVAGINMRDALGKHYTGLDGRDDLMFQNENVGTAISCRFQVWSLSFTIFARIGIHVASSFPGIRRTAPPRLVDLHHPCCHVLTGATDFHLGLEKGAHPDNSQ